MTSFAQWLRGEPHTVCLQFHVISLSAYVLTFFPPFRSDMELLGPNNQYLPKIVSVFAEVCFPSHLETL